MATTATTTSDYPLEGDMEFTGSGGTVSSVTSQTVWMEGPESIAHLQNFPSEDSAVTDFPF